MDLTLDIARTARDFEQILALQRQNHLHAVAPEDRSREGFVFAQHTLETLEAFAAQLPQVVARSGGEVVGYTLAMPVSMRDALPELVAMFAQLERMQYRGRPIADHRYVVGGQVCVAREARGRGLIGRLYDECRRRLPPGHELLVTEINARNEVSLRAHRRAGFEPIGSYQDGAEEWIVVAWDLTRAAELDESRTDRS